LDNSSQNGSHANRIIDLSLIRAILLFLIKKETRKTGLIFIGTIATTFFLPQYQGRLRIKKRKVVNVDHELDRLIPFSADYVKIYLGFIPLWIKSIYFIYLEFGKRSLPLIVEYFNNIGQLYKSSFDVSDRCQSTTTRPGSGRNIPLKLIHWADPHLHCVPSLHVMIVCFNHLRIGTIIRELEGETNAYEAELDYLKNQAILIINSILFMKQHSINCIPAGLFALSTECSEFTDEYALNLIDDIRKMNTDSIVRMEEIAAYISDLYLEFRKSSDSDSSKEILINFLLRYDNKSAAKDR
jgi:hypothetical protein